MFLKKDVKGDAEAFAIFDSKVGSYNFPPSFAPNRHVMIREITNMFKDPSQAKNQLLTNAEDFALFKIGTYDRSTGALVGCAPEHIANLHELRSLIQQETGLTGPQGIVAT